MQWCTADPGPIVRCRSPDSGRSLAGAIARAGRPRLGGTYPGLGDSRRIVASGARFAQMIAPDARVVARPSSIRPILTFLGRIRVARRSRGRRLPEIEHLMQESNTIGMSTTDRAMVRAFDASRPGLREQKACQVPRSRSRTADPVPVTQRHRRAASRSRPDRSRAPREPHPCPGRAWVAASGWRPASRSRQTGSRPGG